MNAIHLPVELAGRRYDAAHLRDALSRHTTAQRISPVHMLAARRLAGSRAVSVEGLRQLGRRLNLSANVNDGGATYQVSFALEPRDNELQVETANCTCERSAPCRHSMALSMDVTARGRNAGQVPGFRAWLDTALSLAKANGPLPAARDHQLDVVWPHTLARIPLPMSSALDGGQIAPLDPDDSALDLVEKGALVNTHDARRITLGEPVAGPLEWAMDEEGLQRLTWNLSPGQLLIGDGRRLLLYDSLKAELSPLRQPRALCEWMVNAPGMEGSAAAATISRIKSSGDPLPHPQNMDGATLVLIQPRVDVHFGRIRVEQSRTGAAVWMPTINVEFAYDIDSTRSPSQETRSQLGILYQRDKGFEDRFVRTLVAAGLELETSPRKDPNAQHWVFIPERARRQGAKDLLGEHLETLAAAGANILLPPGVEFLRLKDADIEIKPVEGRRLELRLMVESANGRQDITSSLIESIRKADFPWEPSTGESTKSRWMLSVSKSLYVSLPLARVRALGLPLRESTEGRQLKPGHPLDISILDAVSFAPLIESDTSGGAAVLREVLATLESGQSDFIIPSALQTTLRGYQVDGISWLSRLAQFNAGGILADDMGLGKTLQILAHILSEREQGRLQDPILIVAPLTLLGVWVQQCAQHAPSLPIRVIQGNGRVQKYRTIERQDVVVVTYGTVCADADELSLIRWGLVVADEAQNLKNPETLASRSFARLKRDRTILASGTPIENRLLDLWSLMSHAQPGYLGSRPHFNRLYKGPIERDNDRDRQVALRRKIRPLILRRMKSDVAAELPPKTYQVMPVHLEGPQLDLYEATRASIEGDVLQKVRENGIEKSGVVVLEALLRLRQVCCSPRLGKHGRPDINVSAKQALLLDLLENLVQAGRKVLVFSAFAQMVDLISGDLEAVGMKHAVVTGKVADRDSQIRSFKQGECSVMLLTLKVGSSGLNLQEADTVIIYDPWWNGAIELQAEDRAHRMGQANQVTIYRLMCPGTVEEKILAIANRKLQLASALLDPDQSLQTGNWLTVDEIEELFSPSVN